MKKVCLSLLIILFGTLQLLGQNNDIQNQSASFRGIISGTVFDTDGIRPLPAVSIMLCNTKDSSIVQGIITTNTGKFILKTIKEGPFFLKLRYIGYQDKIITPILLNPQNTVAAFPKIVMTPSSKRLQEVVVTAEPPEIEQTADKTTLNVARSLTAAGGNALDLMQQIPGVNVNTDGTVQLRGNAKVKILMDGRPSMFTSLDQIPAQMLDKIEVMTNPSARYEADGQAGIINLVTNKNKIKGYMINLTTNGNTRGAFGGGTNIGYRHGHWNLRAFYNYSSSNINSNTKDSLSYFDRDVNTLAEILSKKIDQQTQSNRKNHNHNFRFNTDYFFDENTTLTFQTGINTGGGDNRNQTAYNYQYFSTIQGITNRTRKSLNSSNNHSANFLIAFDKKFTSTKELSTEISLNTGRSKNDQNIDETYENGNSDTILQFNNNNNKNHNINYKLDYEQFILNNVKLEAGERSNWDNSKQIHNAYDINPTTNAATLDSLLLNNYNFNRTIHSAYMVLTIPVTPHISIKAGARYEYTKDTGTQNINGNKFNISYQNIYPSIFITRKFNDFNQINLIYSRRMDRPSPTLLNPLINKSNPLAISIGNSNLKPEDVHSFELKYIYNPQKINITGSIYSKVSKDIIARSVTMKGDTSITSYLNQNSGFRYGGDFSASIRFSQNARIGFDTNWNRLIMKRPVTNLNTDTRLTTWYMRLNSNFNIPDIIGFQILSNYNGPTHRTTGSTEGFFTTDIGLRKEFFNKKITAFARVNDLFNTRKSNNIQKGFISETEIYYRAIYGRQSSRFLTFGLNVNFSNFIRKAKG